MITTRSLLKIMENMHFVLRIESLGKIHYWHKHYISKLHVTCISYILLVSVISHIDLTASTKAVALLHPGVPFTNMVQL